MAKNHPKKIDLKNKFSKDFKLPFPILYTKGKCAKYRCAEQSPPKLMNQKFKKQILPLYLC